MMAKARQVVLTPEQERELIGARDHHQKAYMRTKAAAILKVAAGQAMRRVAKQGLLKPVKEEAVSHWIDRSLAEGLKGLLVRKGRGRKPAFSPGDAPLEVDLAVADLTETLHPSPEVFGLQRSRLQARRGTASRALAQAALLVRGLARAGAV